MGMMGSGYGSECHLLRYLGRHRALLDRSIVGVTGAAAVEWLDYPFDHGRSWHDGEWKGVDFLSDDAPARAVWRNSWPQTGNSPNWDAIGRLHLEASDAWLLVEAKGARRRAPLLLPSEYAWGATADRGLSGADQGAPGRGA